MFTWGMFEPAVTAEKRKYNTHDATMNWEKELDIEIQALVSQLNKMRKEKVKSNRPPESATSLTAECEPPRVPQPDAAPRVDRAKKSVIRKQLRKADGDISESAAKRSRP